MPLTKAHELVVVSGDGRRAYLTGGNLLTGGWNGLTVIDLEDVGYPRDRRARRAARRRAALRGSGVAVVLGGLGVRVRVKS